MIISLLMCTMSAVPDGNVMSGGVIVSTESMIEELQDTDVVFIGEKHDDPLAHQWELFIWEALARPGRTLALEMFETDVQGLVNSYLAGELSEEEFLAGSRPWGNYETDYAPLVNLAMERQLPVIAANVPRRFAALVASGGWEALAGEPSFKSPEVDSSSVSYRERFMETMEAVGGEMHGMPMDRGNLYRAQLLKDAVMASSINGIPCVFICGSFHSDFHSGILDQMNGALSTATVKILPDGEEYDPEMADFVIVR